MNCRTTITVRKIWEDNNNINNTRPDSVEINLLRDNEFYKSEIIDETDNWSCTFCCLPVWKSCGHKYKYEVEEPVDLNGYTVTINGHNITNKIITSVVTYDPNGGTGTHKDTDILFNSKYTVLSSTAANISYQGKNFVKWNTKMDGNGTSYDPGNIITITDDVTLYAQWT